ncbi:ribosome maturation factor RimM [Propioniciclava sp. MC1595]|uniref:ribosome maturation factor RimM n=1 Tax=Propioniciclava sp. MC1595 TaxID=2760308 RepID=UPI00166289E0|nr:ribosome maturation factor RimM [Propioniciclava sp. MC1595]MBB1493910.1 ribosome maturation factor RimM [Propioniciclava sp. MC1595]QTE24905.1 ribosome maturation factor RimM [Propioniciclava sp. MC1595]
MGETVDVLVGTIGRAHGLRGEVSVHVRTDEPERRFTPGASLRVGDRPRTVASARWHSGTLLLGLEGVTDRTAAEALRGRELWADVPAGEAPADEGEYWDRQLVGLEVLDAAGAVAGTIGEVLHLPAHDVLVVRTSGGDRLVPFVSEVVPVVDLEAGHVRVADIGGLLSDEDA